MKKSILLLFIVCQSLVLAGGGSSLVVSKRASTSEKTIFECRGRKNNWGFFRTGFMNNGGPILYSSKLYSLSGDPLDLSFSPIDSVVINVGDRIDHALSDRSNLNSLISNLGNSTDQASFLACSDSQSSRADYYVLNSASITSFSLQKAVKLAQHEEKTNVIFRQSLRFDANAEYLASQYKQAVTAIGRNLDGIDKIGFSFVLDESDIDVNPSEFIEVFHKKFKEEDLDSGELPFELIRLDKDGNLDGSSTQNESSSRWSSWFSYFKQPKIVFSFVTTAGVCLGTYWLVKKNWFSENY